MTIGLHGTGQVLYLLHWHPPLHKAQHYLGITRTERLRARLEEHAAGRGATITRRALEIGASIYLARVFPEANPAIEKMVKRGGHFRDLCPICKGKQPIETAELLHPRCLATPAHLFLSFPQDV